MKSPWLPGYYSVTLAYFSLPNVQIILTSKELNAFSSLLLLSTVDGNHLSDRRNQQTDRGLASFPGLPQLQFLITCSMQKLNQKAWRILPHDPRQGQNILSCFICMAMLQRGLILCFVLATKTRQRRRTTTSSIQNISELEAIALKGCQTTCVKYPQ